MKTRSVQVLALVLPTIAGMVGGWIVGMTLYHRAVQEIERTWHRPANVAISDLSDVLFGYTFLGVFAGTLLGLLMGVFLFVLLKNRKSEPFPTLRSNSL
jgi:hypothetical protein